MAAAVLAGGASRRMGMPKAGLPYGSSTLLAFQTARLARVFDEVFVVAKQIPDFASGPARLVLDRVPDFAPIHGLLRALEETEDRVFVLAVDLPLLSAGMLEAIARRGLQTTTPALVPQVAGVLQPLAAVWRRSILETAEERITRGELSLQGLVQAVGAELFPEEEWRRIDPSGNSFANVNTVEQYLAIRERA